MSNNNLRHNTRFCRMNNIRTPIIRSQNMNPKRNVNNNVRRYGSVKGKQVESLNKIFLREGTPTSTKLWVENKG